MKRFRRTESVVLNGGSPRHSGWTGVHNCNTMPELKAQYQRNPAVLTMAQREAVERRYPSLKVLIMGALWLMIPTCALYYVVQTLTC